MGQGFVEKWIMSNFAPNLAEIPLLEDKKCNGKTIRINVVNICSSGTWNHQSGGLGRMCHLFFYLQTITKIPLITNNYNLFLK